MTGFFLMNDVVAIGIGAFLGAMSRYQIGKVASEYIASKQQQQAALLPPTATGEAINNIYQKYQGWHTAVINIGGSFILGGVAASPVVTPSSTGSSTFSPPQDVAKTTTTTTKATISNTIPQQQYQPKPFQQYQQQNQRILPSSPFSLFLKQKLNMNNNNNNNNNVRLFPMPTTVGLSPRTKLLLGVGFCGSFTTFSTYSVDVVQWIQQGKIQTATAYILVNNVGGIAAAALGMMLVKKII